MAQWHLSVGAKASTPARLGASTEDFFGFCRYLCVDGREYDGI